MRYDPFLRLRVLALGALATFAVVGALGTARATVLVRLSIADLARQSRVIVRGVVRDSSSAWNQDHSRIVTYTAVATTSYVHGTGPRVLRVRQIGGTVGGLHAEVRGNARLTVNEEVLLFLTTDESGDYFVVGMAQGKFRLRVDPASGRILAERDLGDVALAEVESSGLAVVQSDLAEAPRRLDALLAEIRVALGGGR